mmetsp:Transcript_32337/g.93150  ORF Transcript_32337/g.93150 Transcript_32337/m.93150 type:complete len:253 (-) Transcript_32337:257-1015(-)
MPFFFTVAVQCPPMPDRMLETRHGDGGKTLLAQVGPWIQIYSTLFVRITWAAAMVLVDHPPSIQLMGTGMAADSLISRCRIWFLRSLRFSTTWASPGFMLASEHPWVECKASALPHPTPNEWDDLSASRLARSHLWAASPCGMWSARPSFPIQTGGAGTTTVGGLQGPASTLLARLELSHIVLVTSGSSVLVKDGSRQSQSTHLVTSSRSSATLWGKASRGPRTTTRTQCSGSPGRLTVSRWKSLARTASLA